MSTHYSWTVETRERLDEDIIDTTAHDSLDDALAAYTTALILQQAPTLVLVRDSDHAGRSWAYAPFADFRNAEGRWEHGIPNRLLDEASRARTSTCFVFEDPGTRGQWCIIWRGQLCSPVFNSQGAATICLGIYFTGARKPELRRC